MDERDRELRRLNNEKRKKTARRRRLFFSFLLAVLLIAGAVTVGSRLADALAGQGLGGSGLSGTGSGGLNGEAIPDEPQRENPVLLTISCVGDVMVHQSQITAQYDGSSGTYDFNNNFQYIKPYIESADLALCNIETTFRGEPYQGYPVFSAPETLANALKNNGFQVAITANNHMMDTGFSGMQRTIEILRAAGLYTVGSRYEGERSYQVIDVKGVKVGVIAYTYATPDSSGRTTINGNPLSQEAEPLINYFRYGNLDWDMAKIQAEIEGARDDGAELIVCYFHWGEEYQRSPNDWQTYIARQVADMGADMVFASHPHVLQGVEMLVSDVTGKRVPVFYSMGNLISNQRYETLENRYTEQGMIANVQLEYMQSTGEVLSVEMDVIPTWVDKYAMSGKNIYAIVPLVGDYLNNEALQQSGHGNRAAQALEDVKALIGEQYIRVQ